MILIIREILNATKILIIFVLIPFISFSQKKDAHFLLDNNNPKYVFFIDSGKINSKTNLYEIDNFHLFWRDKYKTHKNNLQKFEQKLKDLGRNPTLEEFNQRPRLKSWDFEVISRKKIEISHCELHKIKLVDFEWLKKNSWKENNKNILFKDLYFLLKINDEKYIYYKVGRTITES